MPRKYDVTLNVIITADDDEAARKETRHLYHVVTSEPGVTGDSRESNYKWWFWHPSWWKLGVLSAEGKAKRKLSHGPKTSR